MFALILVILINDHSRDNSLNVILEIQKEDPRIKIINNEKNLGILYSRSKAVLEAKGKYILNLDNDDFFLDEDLFQILYEEAEEGDFDIVSFIEVSIKSYKASINEMKDGFCTRHHKDNDIVLQPELTYYPLFKNGKFRCIDIQIWGKLIRTDVYKKAIYLLGKERYSIYNVYNEDIVALFAICNVAESYKYVRKYGLFHIVEQKSASNIAKDEHKNQMAIFFTEIVFDLSKNEKKRFAVNLLLSLVYSPSQKNNIYLSKVIKKIIDCENITENDKNKLRKKYKEIFLSNLKK